MGSFIVCCSFVFSLLNPGLTFENNFPNSITFLDSTFNESPLPTQAENKESYTIALVGDSMTQQLGTADPLRDTLKQYYPGKGFGILNFGIGSTSILSVPDRLTKESKRESETLPPILDTKPEIILLESFGNNPLSQFPLDEGLKKQTETLDQIIKIIKEKAPKTVLLFVATIAPSKEKYAQGVTDLSLEQRKKWAEERIEYIKNHIKYAKEHNIPVVNIYEKSLTEAGDGNLDYINSSDFIHPSASGIQFIDIQIANFLFENKILPL